MVVATVAILSRKCYTWKDCPDEWARLSTQITLTCARRVARTRLKHLGHPARALGLVPKNLYVFVIFCFASIPSPWLTIPQYRFCKPKQHTYTLMKEFKVWDDVSHQEFDDEISPQRRFFLGIWHFFGKMNQFFCGSLHSRGDSLLWRARPSRVGWLFEFPPSKKLHLCRDVQHITNFENTGGRKKEKKRKNTKKKRGKRKEGKEGGKWEENGGEENKEKKRKREGDGFRGVEERGYWGR